MNAGEPVKVKLNAAQKKGLFLAAVVVLVLAFLIFYNVAASYVPPKVRGEEAQGIK